MPVYNVDQVWLEKAIDSVINQLYENWELCIADDASTKKHIKKTLERYSKKDNRIRVRYLEENQGIAEASNEALSLATGEFIGLLDNDDELRIDAIYENVKLLNKNPEPDLIYSDEDKIDTRGNRTEPFFKPDYSPDFLLTRSYICHFSLFKRSIINDIGGFRKGYEGSQDYDLILRFIEKTKPERIFHIPKILYHWRKIPGSVAMIADAKSYAFVSAKKALSDYLQRNSIQGEVVDGNLIGSYRVKREINNDYKVSIIIPFKDQSKVLRTCVNSIIGRTKYREYEIVLDNSSFRILAYDKPFNFSAINNYAVSQVDSEYIVLLNNDTEVISPDWIENMLEFAQRKDVGAVGALLYYPNDTIQHAGVIVGLGGVAAHAHKHFNKDSRGYFGRIKLVHNLSAVTAACLMTKKSIFNEVGGFDVNLSHAFNDVDYCLKIRERGYLIVYTPYAELYHHESISRGYEDTPEKQARFRKEIKLFQGKWKDVLAKGDPYYNPNLTLDKEDFSIRI
jgi:GT2 family glycosyltransferase